MLNLTGTNPRNRWNDNNSQNYMALLEDEAFIDDIVLIIHARH